VQLATLLNASLLIVGTNGYVLGLHPTLLTTLWESSLPGSAFNIVSVLCTCSNPRDINPEFYVYAGCNGYTYRLTTMGDVVATNPLAGYGKHKVRLVLICRHYALVSMDTCWPWGPPSDYSMFTDPQLQALASGEEAVRPAVEGEVVISLNSEVGFIYLTFFYVH
jgi:hypothetical protein